MTRTHIIFGALLVAAFSCSAPAPTQQKTVMPVDFSKVTIEDGFWSPWLQRHHDVTIPVCIDQIENQTNRIRNFVNVVEGGEHVGFYFDDSDVYKALEGMAYSLINNPDPELEAKCDDWIGKIAAAQQEDGYLNTYYTIAKPGERWTDMEKHELYCTGHLLEAAVAYYRATGKRQLLDVAQRMVDYTMTVIGPEGKHWVPGHEEIELALVKLFEVTGEKKYLEFADWLLDQRGHGYGFYWGEKPSENRMRYFQDLEPVRDLTDIYGHAVRAMYLYCGMADVAAYTKDEGMTGAMDRLWEDVVLRNMYVTGGIGQSASNEGFSEDYDLPNLTAYCETCASVGMILWNWRMNQMKGDAKYADIVEKAMYNGALAGISLTGDRFFYDNPLESLGNHHRQAWFGCACCPSNICRFLPSIGNYIYGTSEKALWVNLYMGNTGKVEEGVTLTQKTDYPWDGRVVLTVGTEKRLRKEIRLRIPAWCKEYTVEVRGKQVHPVVEKGYAVLEGPWKDGDEIVLSLDMPAVATFADPRVKEDEGKCAIMRGPIVYCMEELDNADSYDDVLITAGTDLLVEKQEGLLGGVMTITADMGGKTCKFIPYYAWDNREPGRMKVWVAYE